MYKVQYLDSETWIECYGGGDEQQSLVQATRWASFNPERRVRVVYEEGGRTSVVFFI